MLRHRSAIKRARQNKKRRARNRKTKSEVRKVIKQVVKTKDKEQLNKAYSIIDRAAKTGALHRNTAGRKKSKLAKLVNLSSSSETPKPLTDSAPEK